MGSSNPINVLRACMKGLKSQKSPKDIAYTRGKYCWDNKRNNKNIITKYIKFKNTKSKKRKAWKRNGSSKGKTSGRGHKGQKSRSGVAIKVSKVDKCHYIEDYQKEVLIQLIKKI